jgi:hypothetical protein
LTTLKIRTIWSILSRRDRNVPLQPKRSIGKAALNLPSNWPKGQLRYILFDEAQDSYWDALFWNEFLKPSMLIGSLYRIIMFCGYESSSNIPNEYKVGIPLVIGRGARISLCASDNGPGLESAVYGWSAGHLGAVKSILAFILGKVCLANNFRAMADCSCSTDMKCEPSLPPSLWINGTEKSPVSHNSRHTLSTSCPDVVYHECTRFRRKQSHSKTFLRQAMLKSLTTRALSSNHYDHVTHEVGSNPTLSVTKSGINFPLPYMLRASPGF